MSYSNTHINFNCYIHRLSSRIVQLLTLCMISFVTLAADVTITSAPSDQTIASGGTAKFNVSAKGSGTLKYQWYKNGKKISGKTSRSLSISKVSSSHLGYYQVKVYNTKGSAWSRKAYLKLSKSKTSSTSSSSSTSTSNDIVITKQETAYSRKSGQDLWAPVKAKGSGTLKYQWYKGNTAIKRTNYGLWLSKVTKADAGQYRVKISNSKGYIYSDYITLTVDGNTGGATTVTTSKNTDIVITKQETAYSRKSGQDLWAPVKAKGSGTLKYQWYKGDTPIKRTSSGLWLSKVKKADAGQYRVKISNSKGYIYSDYITLTVDGYTGTSGALSGTTSGTDTEATITWAIPTKRENGKSLSKTNLSKFRIYQTDSAGKSEKMYELSGVYTQHTITDLARGRTYHFAVTAVDSSGRESDLSTVVSKTIR